MIYTNSSGSGAWSPNGSGNGGACYGYGYGCGELIIDGGNGYCSTEPHDDWGEGRRSTAYENINR